MHDISYHYDIIIPHVTKQPLSIILTISLSHILGKNTSIPFLNLPNEIILQICGGLEKHLPDISSLSGTNTRLSNFTIPTLLYTLCRLRSRKHCRGARRYSAERAEESMLQNLVARGEEDFTGDKLLLALPSLLASRRCFVEA